MPTDLNGTFLKNGPNVQFKATVKREHWFAGDGMIHAFQLKNGQPLNYCRRYTKTNKFKEE